MESLVANLKERLAKVESDLMIDMDGDGIPDIQQIAEVRQNQEEAANELQNKLKAIEQEKSSSNTNMNQIKKDMLRLI